MKPASRATALTRSLVVVFLAAACAPLAGGCKKVGFATQAEQDLAAAQEKIKKLEKKYDDL